MSNNMLSALENELSGALATVDEKLAELEPGFRRLAEQKAALLQEKLARLDEILRQRDQAATQLNNLQKTFPGLVTPSGAMPQAHIPQEAIRNSEFASLRTWEAAQEVLRREGKPMYTGEIAEKVIAGGKELGNLPSSKINGAMSQKTDIFVFKKRRNKSIWRLREWEEEKDEVGLEIGG